MYGLYSGQERGLLDFCFRWFNNRDRILKIGSGGGERREERGVMSSVLSKLGDV